MKMIKLLVKIIILFIFINSPTLCKVISNHQTELDRKINDVNYGRSSERHLNMNFTDTSINLTNATSDITLSRSDINSLTTHMPLNQQRSIGKLNRIDRSIHKLGMKISSVLHGAKHSFRTFFMHYSHYGPEIGFCSCLSKYAWYHYPIVSDVTYATLGNARKMMTNFMEDVMRGFTESYYNSNQEVISAKVAQPTTYDDYYDYQQNQMMTQDYGPSRRIGKHESEIYPENQQNVQVIEKADPKLVPIVDMLKNLQPKVNQNDGFIIRYARALNSYSQYLSDEEKKLYVNKDKIRKYPKKHQHESTIKMNETSVGSVNSSSINEGRSMGNEFSNNRRVLVPGVPAGLPSFDELPPADYTYVKNNVVHHVHDLRNGNNQRPKRYFFMDGFFSGNVEEKILSWMGYPRPDRSFGAFKPTIADCVKAYGSSIVMRHVHMLLFG
ncbi:uncharacterized protein [Chironomus tepperi]|uniref:uncharacterized protein n=1 Tax=Chironomus tepperi TaxID=113505 RepID=UPI00391EE9F3